MAATDHQQDAESVPVVDLTDAVEKAIGVEAGPSDIQVTLVPLDMAAKAADVKAMPFSHVSVQRQ